MTISLNTSKAIYTIEALASEKNMEDKEMKLSERLKGVDVKIVWKEEEKTKEKKNNTRERERDRETETEARQLSSPELTSRQVSSAQLSLTWAQLS